MTPEQNDRSVQPIRRAFAGNTTTEDEVAHKRRRDRVRRRHTAARRSMRRLGPLEYTLLALIALGIAITIVMAILDPSG